MRRNPKLKLWAIIRRTSGTGVGSTCPDKIMPLAVEIVRSKPEDAAVLTEIAFAGKRQWGYPERWIQKWREVLTIDAGFINQHETYAAVFSSRTVGFYALCQDRDRLRLEHLWVVTDAIGQGIGRILFTHAVGRASALGYLSLEIESEPNAEGFYLRMGARRIGSNIAELEGRPRELPILRYEFLPME
jgi:GNAT superfamily N-acetyltransferase